MREMNISPSELKKLPLTQVVYFINRLTEDKQAEEMELKRAQRHKF